jgi:hypothetical protein
MVGYMMVELGTVEMVCFNVVVHFGQLKLDLPI